MSGDKAAMQIAPLDYSGDAVSSLGPIGRENLAERVYGELRKGLLQGRFWPGERLKIRAATLHDIEHGGNDVSRIAHVIAEHIVRCHLRTMGRLDIDYDLLTWEGHILRLQCFRQSLRWRLHGPLLEDFGFHQPGAHDARANSILLLFDADRVR